MSKQRHAAHGGAWKVAYADFVTAMMALFLVLWLSSQDTKIKKAVERSFKNPFATLTKESTGIMPSPETPRVKMQQGNFDSSSAIELNFLRKISDDILKKLNPEMSGDDNMRVELTSDGVRLNIFDRAKKPIFEPGTAKFTEHGAWVFSTISWVVAESTNFFQIELEGHTEAGIAPKSEDYGSWELSADRANAARRKITDNGVDAAQIRKVISLGDTVPLPEYPPTDERNRRVTVMLRVKTGSR